MLMTDEDIVARNVKLIPQGYRLVRDTRDGWEDQCILEPLEWKVQETCALNKARALDQKRRLSGDSF